jgi:phosphopantothenoylcysteine decarboxylase
VTARRPRILLGVTGSVAAKLTPKLIIALDELGEVQVVATDPSLYFWRRKDAGVRVWTASDEWPGSVYQKDQEIPHIALGDWADILVVAPLTANTLTKMAVGLVDNLLTSIYYAWPERKPVVLAPAMNTRMWNNVLTERHLAALRDWPRKLTVVPPVSKRLACGATGRGAMADIGDIKSGVSAALSRVVIPENP